MYIVIGKIKDFNTQKLEACRVVDTETKEVRDIAIQKIREAVKRGIRVQGFRRINSIVSKSKEWNVQTEVTKDETARFKWKKVPMLTGAGELVDIQDEKYLTIFGWEGFAEMKMYYLLNWKGEEVVLDADKFMQKLKAGEINGASFDAKYNRPLIVKELNQEIVRSTGGNN